MFTGDADASPVFFVSCDLKLNDEGINRILD